MIFEEQKPEENNVAPEEIAQVPVQQEQPPVTEQQPPAKNDTITAPNGRTFKKDHLEYKNGVPYVKPEYRSLYQGSGFMYWLKTYLGLCGKRQKTSKLFLVEPLMLLLI
jgi:hypothetical protein